MEKTWQGKMVEISNREDPELMNRRERAILAAQQNEIPPMALWRVLTETYPVMTPSERITDAARAHLALEPYDEWLQSGRWLGLEVDDA